MKITELCNSKLLFFVLFLAPLLFFFSCTKDKTPPLITSDEVAIISFKILNNNGIIIGSSIKVNVLFGTDITKLKAVVEISDKATISPDPSKYNDYTNPLKFTITTKDKNISKTYKITVKVIDPIISWTAGWRDDTAKSAIINQSTGEIKIDLSSADFDTKVTLSDGAVVTPLPKYVNDWSSEVTFTAKKGSKTKVYKVKATVDGKDIVKVTDSNISKIHIEIAKHGNTANYNYIDVSSVTNMRMLFGDKYYFNGDISKWDVSNVKNMTGMFYRARVFNQNIGSWDLSNLNYISYMFYEAEAFNRDISSWNIKNVNNLMLMFYMARAFNKDISSWNIKNVNNISYMFDKAESFNQDLSAWNSKADNVNKCKKFANATISWKKPKPKFKNCKY